MYVNCRSSFRHILTKNWAKLGKDNYKGIQGRRTKIGQGGREVFGHTRAKFFPPPERSPPPGHDFSSFWAYFSFFSRYIVRIAKSSWGRGSFPPLRSSARGISPPQFYAYVRDLPWSILHPKCFIFGEPILKWNLSK